MPPLLERLGVELPVVQAGMGGGLSRHELAAAVSEAGGLGTIAVSGATAIRRELAAARALTAQPIATEVITTLGTGIGLVLAVPITTAIAAVTVGAPRRIDAGQA